MRRFFIIASQFLLIVLFFGIPCVLSLSGGPQTEKVQTPFEDSSSVLSWNTFMGSTSTDKGRAITVDGSGNVYVAGDSYATWGTPVNAYTGSYDIFVAKLNSSGELQWNTFIGSTSIDYASGIALDGSGNVYVLGDSFTSWGTPIDAHVGSRDAFVAKLNSSGELQWNTFMGSSGYNYGHGIAVDGSGNVYVAGTSPATWGTPVNAYVGSNDAYVAKLNSSGNRQWNTFMGSSSPDGGSGITVDGSGNVYAVGSSNATWGTPINAYVWSQDGFVIKLNSSGARQWNTFMGSNNYDVCLGMGLDGTGNIYVSGYSDVSWGSPVDPHSGNYDAFASKLNNSGIRQWNTFMGSSGYDTGNSLAVDTNGNVSVGGNSDATWGTPINAHAGNMDAFAVNLDSDGIRQWHTFLGSGGSDTGEAIAMNDSGNVYAAGQSAATWGTPVNGFTGGSDAFVAKFVEYSAPEPDIKANGSDSTITITQGDALSVNIELSPGSQDGEDADWWILMKTSDPKPNNWYYFNVPTKSWMLGRSVTLQRSLFDVDSKKVPKTSGLTPGTYTFYIAVDMVMNGAIDVSEAFYDKIKVIINP
jgi:hypothetical protein